MLVTMGTALTVEYTTVGSLFTNIINTTAIPVVIIIGVISSVYAAYGGLHISLITDQVQVGPGALSKLATTRMITKEPNWSLSVAGSYEYLCLGPEV